MHQKLSILGYFKVFRGEIVTFFQRNSLSPCVENSEKFPYDGFEKFKRISYIVYGWPLLIITSWLHILFVLFQSWNRNTNLLSKCVTWSKRGRDPLSLLCATSLRFSTISQSSGRVSCAIFCWHNMCIFGRVALID